MLPRIEVVLDGIRTLSWRPVGGDVPVVGRFRLLLCPM